MPKINLLYVITKLELGGAQKQLLSLITHLDLDKYNIFLFTAMDGLLLADFSSLRFLTIKKSRFLERAIHPLKDPLVLWEIYNYIKKNKIDIVHTHSSKAGILGRCAGRLAGPGVIVHTVHGWSFNDYQPFWLRKLFIFLERLAAGFTDKLIVVSGHDRELGLANRIGTETKYILIRYGIDYAQFGADGNGIRKELGLGSTDIVVGTISCFKPQKSPLDFIKLASLLLKRRPGTKFLLIGDGALREKIETLIRRLNLQDNIILPGWRRDIPRLLSAVDVFALTSLWEGLPISVLEAMASALPVVATDTGGVREVILEGRTGYLVRPLDIKTMSDKTGLLLDSRQLRSQFGEKAKSSLGVEFSIHNMAQRTRNLYGDIWDTKHKERRLP